MTLQTSRQPWRRAALLAALAVTAASCKGKTEAPATAAGGGGAPAISTAAGIPPIVNGTAAGLRQYLSTVDTVVGATFDVTWRPEVVRLDRATVLRALEGVSPDGQTFLFAANEPAVAQIKPGTVLLVWGVALGRVLTVDARSDGVLVRTTVASLTDAIDHGHIAWKVTPDFSHGVVAPIYEKPDTLAVSALPPRRGSLFRPASFMEPAYLRAALGDSTPDQSDDAPPADSIPVAAVDIKKGEVAGFEYEVGYLYSGGGLDFELEASRKDKPGDAGKDATKSENQKIIQGLGNMETNKPGAPPPAQGTDQTPEQQASNALKSSLQANKAWQKAKKDWDRKSDLPNDVWGAMPQLVTGKLWALAKEQFDLRIKAQGHIDGLNLGGDISISNAKQIVSNFKFDDLSGIANIQYVARLGGDQGNWDEKLKASMPVTFNIPILIGGLPFMFQVGVNMFAIPALSTKHATVQGQLHLNFAGGGVVQAGSGNLDANGQYTGNAFIVEGGNDATSLGISALLVSIEFPRFGFGMGLFNAYSIAFVDFVGTGSVLTSGAVGMMPCKRYQVDAVVGAGVATQVLGLSAIPVIGKLLTDKVNKKLSWRKSPELWQYEHIVTKPEGLNCEFKGKQ